MLHIIPSIFVKNGKCTAMNSGLNNKYTFLGDTPLDLALKFQDCGIKKLQLIDLDGVETDMIKNLPALHDLSSLTKLEILFGGGVNTDEEMKLAFDYGASQVICSTLPSNEKEFFGSWILNHGRDKVILNIDVIDNKVNVYGGAALQAKEEVLSYMEYFYHCSALFVKCTELSTLDGSSGPAYDLYNKIKNRFPDLKLVASGGVRNIEDIKRLQEQGMYAIVFGKAFYDGGITLDDLKKLNL